jgi:hypothetical protein
LPKHASRPNKQYFENVALKINVKVRKPIFFALSFFFGSFMQECINSFHLSRLVGATRFLSEPLYAMAYPLCQKSQQSSLAHMSHTPHQERTPRRPLLLLVSSYNCQVINHISVV